MRCGDNPQEVKQCNNQSVKKAIDFKIQKDNSDRKDAQSEVIPSFRR